MTQVPVVDSIKYKKGSGSIFLWGLAPFVFGLLLSTSAFALSIPEKPQGYVSDYAKLLSDASRQKIENTLGAFEKETSNQVVVAVFESLEGGSLEDFSIRLAEKWKIGQKGKDNGIILIIFKQDRAVRIEVGYGLEGALPDAVASAIIRNEIVPAFRAGDFDKGIESAVGAIIQATKGEYKPTGGSPDEKIKQNGPLIFAAIVLFYMLPIICYLLTMVLALAIFGFPLGLIIGILGVIFLIIARGALMLPLGQTVSSGRRGGYWGGGGFGGGGFSGGFSGGGGGSFGGGGASGGW